MQLLRQKKKAKSVNRVFSYGLFLMGMAAVARAGVDSKLATEILSARSHCVAYQAQKKMFLGLSNNDVVGSNCDIAAQVLPEVGGLYRVEVNVPIKGLQSGNSSWDAEVVKLLKADVRSELTFRSQAMGVSEWHQLLTKAKFELPGELLVGEKTYPLKFDITYHEDDKSAEVSGSANARFEDFGLKPPTVVGGVVAQSSSNLKLLFHLVSDRILGNETLRLQSSLATKKNVRSE